MARVRSSRTTLEVRVAEMLRVLGIRYRVRNADLPGSPDLANRRRTWAIFVHGCFWHAHTACTYATLPKRNRAFWAAKLQKNQERDRRVVARLRAMGFRVVIVWECELDDPRIMTRLARLA